MTRDTQPDSFAEFADELRLLAETVLERVEPVLRRSAAQGQPEWAACSWCPVCAAAALVRGEHHEVVAAIAEHGTAIVTVLREALAGVPVEPVLPTEFDPETGVPHHHPEAESDTGQRTRDADAHRAPAGDATGDRHAPRDSRAADRRQDPAGNATARDTDGASDPSTLQNSSRQRPAAARKRSGYVGIPVTIKA
ncbi:hypothetical protein [Nocardia puris]|uniref:Uncharacterized protein n=1 Tax=Nocardia puris TaxID=208602 RepID=A0A366DJN2_9NOCA|nr:hypothetical protein [Nocardia puris]RBO90236.1 hypothetical protein DFR74_106121 [Nocardia puris]